MIAHVSPSVRPHVLSLFMCWYRPVQCEVLFGSWYTCLKLAVMMWVRRETRKVSTLGLLLKLVWY